MFGGCEPTVLDCFFQLARAIPSFPILNPTHPDPVAMRCKNKNTKKKIRNPGKNPKQKTQRWLARTLDGLDDTNGKHKNVA